MTGWIVCLMCDCPTPRPLPVDWTSPNCGNGFVKALAEREAGR